jgi:MFS family permease
VNESEQPAELDGRAGPTPLLLSFRYPGAKLYFAGLTVSMLGSWMQSIALSWLIVRNLRGGGGELSLQQMAQFLPVALLSAWAGSISDRIDKRRLMICTQIVLGFTALLFAALDFSGRATMSTVIAITAVTGLATAFDTPARRSLIGDLVPHEALPNAMALNTGVITSARIAGVAIGGFVVKYAGTGWCFLFNGLSYFAMIAALSKLAERAHRTPGSEAGDGVLGALVHVWRQPTLRVAMLVTAVVATFTFNFNVTITLMVETVFGRESDSFGLVMMFVSVGSFLGAMLSAKRRRPELWVMLGGAVVMGLSTVLLAESPGLWWFALGSVPMGFGGGLLMSQLSGLLTSLSPPTMRGRVLALQTVVFLGSTPFGSPLVGYLADSRSPRAATAFGGWCALTSGLVGVAALVFWPVLKSPLRRRQPA